MGEGGVGGISKGEGSPRVNEDLLLCFVFT